MLNSNTSIFPNFNSASANDYSNDIFMSNMNFGQLMDMPVSQQSQQTTTTTTSPSQGNQTEDNTQESESGSNKFKILGAIGGCLAPLVPKVIDLFKGGSFTKLFKNKALLPSCGIFGVVGLGAGMLLDSCFSSKKSQSTQQNTQTTDQQQQEIIRNFITK
jgi:predicted ATPase